MELNDFLKKYEGKTIKNIEATESGCRIEFEQAEFEPKDGDFLRSGNCLMCIKSVNGEGSDMIPTYFGLNESRELNFGVTYGNNFNLSAMTDSEKQTLLEALEKDGKQWNAENKRIEPIPLWRAEKNRTYFAVGANGEAVCYVDNSLFDEKAYVLGNYFQTEAEATEFFNTVIKPAYQQRHKK